MLRNFSETTMTVPGGLRRVVHSFSTKQTRCFAEEQAGTQLEHVEENRSSKSARNKFQGAACNRPAGWGPICES